MGRLTRPRTNQLAHSLTQLSRRARSRVGFSNPIYGLKLKGPHPLRLLAAPKDPWSGDRVAGMQILSGGFSTAGQVLTPPNADKAVNIHPWTPEQLWSAQYFSKGWKVWLHGFSWLRDLSTVTDQAAARLRAEALVREWTRRFNNWDPLVWRPDVLAQRIMNWMAYAPLILSTNDHVYRSLVLNSMARQSRHLARSLEDAPIGLGQITAAVGLVYSGLFLPNAPGRLKRGLAELDRQLGLQILADGGIITRNPDDLHSALRDLVALRASLLQMNHDIPEGLQNAIDRIGPMLRSLCHGDGKLSLFNGSHEMTAAELTETLARVGDAGEAFGNASHTGFQRLARGDTVVIADVGPPSPLHYSRNNHAGTLSFEMSDGADRIVVNCGSAVSLPEGRPSAFRQIKASSFNLVSRATAAHSTLVINDTNSSEVLENGLIGDGPTEVDFDRHDEAGGIWVEASHNGYEERFGLIHRRRLFLDPEGSDLRGEDAVLRLGKRGRADRFDIRFHLHPRVAASIDEDGNGVMLRLSSGGRWHFRTKGGALTLEESLYLGRPHQPTKSQHIVVSGEVDNDETMINWSFKRLGEDEAG